MKEKDLINRLKTTDYNLVIMIGIPLSGKSTFITNKIIEFCNIISRDAILLEEGNGKSYTEAFLSVNQKTVSKILNEKITEAGLGSDNTIIDMTSLKPKSRKAHIKRFPNHVKIAVKMPIPSSEILLERNKTRNEEEGKYIPEKVITDMLNSYKAPTKEEGFDFIVDIK